MARILALCRSDQARDNKAMAASDARNQANTTTMAAFMMV